MSAGFLQSWDKRLEVFSAGIGAGKSIRRSGHEGGRSRHFTVCDDADKNCPNFTGKVSKRVHIGFPDPAKATGTDDQKLSVFRVTRDDIQKRFREYYETEIRKKL